ncbi:MAG: DUF6311 domain-containing protein [Ilumatobacteraceae bacterium]
MISQPLLDRRKLVGDSYAALLGAAFYSFTVGLEKLDPRNIAWITHGDQLTAWLGWRFFASDGWRWPLGANPNYGWESKNSIVFSDSWPGLSVISKLSGIESLVSGQFFGLGLLVASVALFIGARRVFERLGTSLASSLLGAALLGLTPLFWWMQRWGPAVSAGTALVVWSFYLYLGNYERMRNLCWRWMVLFALAISTNSYIVIMISAIFVATLLRMYLSGFANGKQLILTTLPIAGSNLFFMFLLGYFTIPAKWSQTGGYGWYSANLLGLLDSNGASRFFPDLPSVSGQHEPTALSTGSILLLAVLLVHQILSRRALRERTLIREHISLIAVLLVLFALAVSNTVSLGLWSIRIPLPQRIEHGLSIFRSSARFVWPGVIALSFAIIALVASRLRYAKTILVIVLVLQLIDYGSQLKTVRDGRNGDDISVVYDGEFWNRVPSRYVRISVHPAASLGHGWAECAYAAVMTNRVGECGYFGRVQGLEAVNRTNSNAFFVGELNSSTIYWVPVDWIQAHRSLLSTVFTESRTDSVVVRELRALGGNSILVVPDCDESEKCRFLGSSVQTFGKFLQELAPS